MDSSSKKTLSANKENSKKKPCHDDIIHDSINGEKQEEAEKALSPKPAVASAEMCFYCFEVLESKLFKKPLQARPKFTNDPYAAFVTWKVGKDARLRGCIGSFKPLPLHENLKDLAISSAFQDSRFNIITKKEFDQLQVSVSLLVNFEPCKDYLDWKVGQHGVRIEFQDEHRHKYTATYLPEVAIQQGWNHKQTMESLLRKGGFRGDITEEVLSKIRVTRYESEKITVSYQEYIDAKENTA